MTRFSKYWFYSKGEYKYLISELWAQHKFNEKHAATRYLAILNKVNLTKLYHATSWKRWRPLMIVKHLLYP